MAVRAWIFITGTDLCCSEVSCKPRRSPAIPWKLEILSNQPMKLCTSKKILSMACIQLQLSTRSAGKGTSLTQFAGGFASYLGFRTQLHITWPNSLRLITVTCHSQPLGIAVSDSAAPTDQDTVSFLGFSCLFQFSPFTRTPNFLEPVPGKSLSLFSPCFALGWKFVSYLLTMYWWTIVFS